MANLSRQTDNEPWSDCPVGEVGGLVDHLQRRHRSEQRRQVAAGIACLAVVLMAGLYAIPHLGLGDTRSTGIVCADVHRLANEYVAGQLDGDMATRIEAHLQRCPPCHTMVENLRSSQAAIHGSGRHPAEADIRTDLVAMSLGSL